MEPIPVIGTVAVNNPYWIARLLMSVDYPVENFVIFNNNARDEITSDLDNIAKINHRYIKKISVCHLPGNIGCAAAWNLIIKSYPMAPYWVIVNNDISFTSGLLEKLINKAKDDNVGSIHAKRGDYGVGNWDLFLITEKAVQKYGLFDENLYPAYCEDVDYIMRFIIDNNKLTQEFIEVDYLHGETFDYGTSGSQTWRSEPHLKEKIDQGRYMNEYEYLNKKWGEGWRWLQPYQTPFNDTNLPITYTTYDLSFIRKKYMGF